MLLNINQNVHNVDLSHLTRYVNWHHLNAWFPGEVGENHHKLLAYLSSQLPKGSKVTDLGTQYGASALALSYNPDVEVTTYDISNQIPDGVPSFRNVKNIKGVHSSCFDNVQNYIDSKLILLDISPHNGSDEGRLVGMLLEREYKGLLICDDILAFPAMKTFWTELKMKKYDVSIYGHWSGTGIVVFEPKEIDVRIA